MSSADHIHQTMCVCFYLCVIIVANITLICHMNTDNRKSNKKSNIKSNGRVRRNTENKDRISHDGHLKQCVENNYNYNQFASKSKTNNERIIVYHISGNI